MIRTLSILILFSGIISGCTQQTKYSDNPVFPEWYADPEGIIYDNMYWIFPTYSAPYEDQVFFDAFSSDDLTNWKKTPGCWIPELSNGPKKPCGLLQ